MLETHWRVVKSGRKDTLQICDDTWIQRSWVPWLRPSEVFLSLFFSSSLRQEVQGSRELAYCPSSRYISLGKVVSLGKQAFAIENVLGIFQNVPCLTHKGTFLASLPWESVLVLGDKSSERVCHPLRLGPWEYFLIILVYIQLPAIHERDYYVSLTVCISSGFSFRWTVRGYKSLYLPVFLDFWVAVYPATSIPWGT